MDTAAKRFSIMDSDCVFQSGIPVPDGAIAQGDRQHFLWGYSGIPWAVPVVLAMLEHVYHFTPMTVSLEHNTAMTVSKEHDTAMTVSIEHSTPMG